MTYIYAATPDRITEAIDNTHYVALQEQTPRMARAEFDQGPADATQHISGISLDLGLSAATQADLDAFLEEQRNPGSPDYHNWLTPEQFADRFGASPNDVAKIVSWLQAQGFTIQNVGAGRTWILFAGSAGQIAQAFHSAVHHYLVNGTMHYANSTVPSIPEALSAVVVSVRGLDDFRPQPASLVSNAKKISPQLDRGGFQFVGPDDFATIYDLEPLYQGGSDGTGQKVAIAGQTDISLLDIAEFRSLFNITPNVPQVVLVGEDPGTSQGDLPEADLDIEWSGAAARNATIIYVNSNNVFTSLQYAIDQDLAPVVSMSYGGCEAGAPTSFRTVAQQANAEGITWMNAAGDQGAAGCDYGADIAQNGPSVIFPADIPEVVAVGGTEFNDTSGGPYWSTTNSATSETALGYIPEKAWNDTSPGNPIEAGGGGVSNLFSKPWWQTGPGVPSDGARDVPDIAMDASADHEGYIIVSSDTMMSIGGTSVSSPAFAGIVALLNQYLVKKGSLTKPGLGNINPTLYALAHNANNIFHDITVGNNIVPCQEGTTGCTTGSFGYNAGPGYDLATGLGSIDAYNLAQGWSGASSGVGVTTTVTASPTSVATTSSTVITATIAAVSGSNAPTGSVTFTLGGNTIGSATLTAGSGAKSSASLTVKGSTLAIGANTISADYLPTGSFLASSGSVNVSVTGTGTSMTLTANPTTMVASASTVLTAKLTATNGATPTGTIVFSANGTTLGSATAAATVTLTVPGTKLEVGANTITATYTATGNFANSTATAFVNVNAVTTTTTVSFNPASVATNSSTVITATIKAASGSTQPTGDVIFMAGATNLGTVVVSNGTASLTVKGSSLVLGSNTITCDYGATGDFASSSGTGTLTVTAPPPATTTTVSASPTTIAATAKTVLTATITPASGNAQPTGTVTFAVGIALLGSATVSGSTASISIAGANLATGNNTITATYTPSGNFASSKGTVTVTVQPVATTTTVTASPASIAPSASTTLTVTVKAATGTTSPTGTVTITAGNKTLGTVSVNGTSATITIKASSLSVGSNTITATYAASGSFAGSSAQVTVTVT